MLIMKTLAFTCLLCLLGIHASLPSRARHWKQSEDGVFKSIYTPSRSEDMPIPFKNTNIKSTVTPRMLQHTDDCPAPDVCSCSSVNNVIDCSGRGLTSVPEFSKSNAIWYLYLPNNHIHNLNDDDFQNIKIQFLDLSNNSLATVSDNAFRGLESSLQTLHIGSNSLTGIPNALMNLMKLSSLKIQQNPISYFDEKVINSLSSSLYTFHFGSEAVTIWPKTLNLLNLFELGIFNLTLEELPETAFANLSLRRLFLNSMKLLRLPSSFKGLDNLYTLSLNTDEDLTLDGIPSSLFERFKGLNWLQIINVKLTALPDIFHYVTGLFQLEINSVPISDFPVNMIPDDSNITIAYFNSTLFNEVPTAFSKMKKLSVLSLNYNNITTLRSADLSGLSKLEYISISNAPLESVSRHAFRTLTSLSYIALDNTALTTIPRAVEGVKFNYLSLLGNKLICTCQSMGWMKNWPDASRVGINGQCNNLDSMQVGDYVRQKVPECP